MRSLAFLIIALFLGVPKRKPINDWIEAMSKGNPFYTGASADLLALIPFAILTILLYLTGRETILASRKPVEE